MNCLTCHNLYKFYEKTKNCLKCPKYVNYLQTECLDTIPDGYYLSDEIYGIIEKCHSLCKTCETGPKTINGVFHMNCKTCLYQSNSKALIEGNCPQSSEKKDIDDKPNDNRRKGKKSNDPPFIWISIILVILILVVISIMIYMKCKKRNNNRIRNTDYYNFGGKNIPFEDEYDTGIN